MIRDSIGLTFEHTQKIKFREARTANKNADTNRDTFEMKANFQPNEEIEPRIFTMKLTFTKPLSEARLNQIQLFSDSTKAEKINTLDFIWDNNRTVLSLTRPIAAKQQLKIMLPKSTFFSVENDTIPERVYKLPIMAEENYGTLEGEVKGAKTKFIVELLDEKFEVIKSIANKTPYQFNYLKPATYSIRIVIDENSNGQWDPGDFRTKHLAEPIIFYPEPVKVKKNFVMSGIDIDLSTK
jgi:hypothetical protein